MGPVVGSTSLPAAPGGSLQGAQLRSLLESPCFQLGLRAAEGSRPVAASSPLRCQVVRLEPLSGRLGGV